VPLQLSLFLILDFNPQDLYYLRYLKNKTIIIIIIIIIIAYLLTLGIYYTTKDIKNKKVIIIHL